ncbi:hypothetical protein ACMFMG_011141 [Clarireedia jacksonii]
MSRETYSKMTLKFHYTQRGLSDSIWDGSNSNFRSSRLGLVLRAEGFGEVQCSNAWFSISPSVQDSTSDRVRTMGKIYHERKWNTLRDVAGKSQWKAKTHEWTGLAYLVGKASSPMTL